MVSKKPYMVFDMVATKPNMVFDMVSKKPYMVFDIACGIQEAIHPYMSWIWYLRRVYGGQPRKCI